MKIITRKNVSLILTCKDLIAQTCTTVLSRSAMQQLFDNDEGMMQINVQ